MKISKAVETIKNLTETIEKQEQFSIHNILQKTAAIINNDQQDKSSIYFSKILNDKLSHGELFISRQDLRKLYNTYYDTKSNLKNALATELNLIKKEIKKQEVSAPFTNFSKISKEQSNQELLHIFEKIAEPNENSSIEKNIIVQCQKYCANELNRFGVQSEIKFAGGQNNLALCQASFSTNKGKTNFLIPIEILENRPLTPTFFLCNSGLIELSEKNIKIALAKHAGEDIKFLPKHLLSVFGSFKNKNNISDVEQIVIKNKLMQSTQSVDGIFGLKIAEPVQEFEFKIPLNDKNQKISEQMSNPHGIAEFKFGKNNVSLGAKIVNQSLNKFGFKNNKIKIASSDENKIYYEVALSGIKSFKIPVKISSSNQPEIPSVMISENGEISNLSLENINKLSPSLHVTASFSNLNELNDSELNEVVFNSMLQKNASKAEEAIELLKSRNSTLLQQAFSIYLKGIAGTLCENQSKCSKPIKVANSIHTLCGHLRIPLNKVYQDEYGQCQHLTRKHMVMPENTAIAAHRIIL